MKIRHPMIMKMASLLLLAAGTAGAQTYFYSDAGSGANAAAGGVSSTGSLASIGFDLSNWNRSGSVWSDTGTSTARPDIPGPGLAYDHNIIAPGLFSGAPAGTVLDSVTIYLYLEAASPSPGPHTYSLYDGFQASLGNLIGSLNVGDSLAGTFVSFTISGDALAGGMAITGDGLANGLMNVSTEMNSLAFQTPGISATYVPIPEPTTALLSCLGAIALFRRRR